MLKFYLLYCDIILGHLHRKPSADLLYVHFVSRIVSSFFNSITLINKYIFAKDYERTLPKPAAPRLVEAGWQTIQLRFNTTELERYSNLHYILEVKPQWVPQERNNLFVVFPYTRKYHNVSGF